MMELLFDHHLENNHSIECKFIFLVCFTKSVKERKIFLTIFITEYTKETFS